MGVTTIKALVNMTSTPVRLYTSEGTSDSGHDVTARPGSVAGCSMAVPWCTSSGEFPGHHLTLTLNSTTTNPAAQSTYSIWQEKKRDGDFVRFTQNGNYSPDARFLGGVYDASRPYYTDGNSEAVLVADQNSWVILYRIGG